MNADFPDEPLLGMYVGRTMRQLVLFCDYAWAPASEAPHGLGADRSLDFVSAFQWLQQNYPQHPITTLANAGIADREFLSAVLNTDSNLKVFDAVADYLIWRFLRAELKGRQDEKISTEPLRAQLSASLAGCFNAFNTVVLGINLDKDITSYKLPDKFLAFELIDELGGRFPLLSELLGYWYPSGNRQYYFFNSDFDYLSEYRVQIGE